MSAVATASATSLGMSPVEVAVVASLVTDPTIGTWSSSWSEPEPQRLWGARPASTTRGEPFMWAVVMALTPLVTPGPAVSTATPGPRVSLAMASAANVAVCSWRTSTMRTSRFTQASRKGKMWPPERVKTVFTPRSTSGASASSPP